MAQNKKTKTSFAESLKAQADKLVPPKTDEEEVINVDLDGVQVPVARGKGKDRLSDSEWEQVKKRAAQPVENVDPKTKEHSWGDIMSLAQDVKGRAKGLVSEEESQLLEKTNEWDRAEFLRQRMKNKGYKVPINSAQDERDSLRGEKTLPAEKPAAPYLSTEDQKKQTEQWKKDQGKISKDSGPTPEEWAPMPGTQTEDTVSSGPGMSPLANAQQMMMGATPKNIVTSSLAEVGQDALNKVAPMEGGFPGASNPAPMEGGFPGASNPAPMEGGFPGLPSLPQGGGQSPVNFDQPMGTSPQATNSPINFDQPAGDNAVSRVLAPDSGAWPGAITSEQAKGLPPSPNAGTVPGVPSPPVPEQGDGGSVSESASVKIPSGFTPVKDTSMVGWDQEVKASKQRLADLADHIGAADIVQQGLTRQASTARIETQKVMDIEAEFASKARLNATQQATRYEAAKTTALQAAREAAATPTEPNRYWNNKDDGQRAAAVIAGALFGFTGQGMQWLQRIDGLIENDMRVQAADRASKVQGLESQARGFGEAADFAMRSGASEAEAHVLARKMKWEGLQSQLEDITAKSTDMQQQVRGQQMLMEIANKQQQLDLQGRDHVSMAIARENGVLADQAKLAQGAAIASFKASGKSKDGKRPPGVRVELAKIESGLQAVKEARSAVGKGVSLTDQMALNLGDALRAVGASGVANFVTPNVSGRAATADTAQENVLKAVKGENLLEADLSRALPRFKRPGLAAENNAWLDAQEQILNAKKNALLTNEAENEVNGKPLEGEGGDFPEEAYAQ